MGVGAEQMNAPWSNGKINENSNSFFLDKCKNFQKYLIFVKKTILYDVIDQFPQIFL